MQALQIFESLPLTLINLPLVTSCNSTPYTVPSKIPSSPEPHAWPVWLSWYVLYGAPLDDTFDGDDKCHIIDGRPEQALLPISLSASYIYFLQPQAETFPG